MSREYELWNLARQKRLHKYNFIPKTNYSSIAEEIDDKGYFKFGKTNFKETLKKILSKTEELLPDIKQTEWGFRTVPNPLVNCPSILDIATDDLLVDIAGSYFGCAPAIGTVNLRRSYPTESIEENTLLFHSDPNSIRFLKFFFYLNDVDMGGGPLTYIEGSNKDLYSVRGRLRGFESKDRWTYDEVIQTYDEDKIKYLTANFGDMVVANTTGMHRGTKVKDRKRTMLTINYTIHPEEWNVDKMFKVRKEDAEKIPEDKSFLLDFLVRS